MSPGYRTPRPPATPAQRRELARRVAGWGFVRVNDRSGWLRCPLCHHQVTTTREGSPPEAWRAALARALQAHFHGCKEIT